MAERTPAFLGIDIGSSELRAGLVTADGHLLGLERARLEMAVDPDQGLAEQDAEAWWTGLATVVRQLRARGSVDIAGIAVDGHGPTLTPVDRNGSPTRRAITWLDQRSAEEQRELTESAGLQGWALGVLPAALWVERHEPVVAARTDWYLNSWEALTLRLTGEARTVLVPGGAGHPTEMLASLGFPAGRLAPSAIAGEIVGTVTRPAAAALGLSSGIPVVAGVVDAFATFHGARMLDAGDAVDVGGSAGGFGVYSDRPVQVAGSFTTPAPLAGLFIVGGAMATLGRSVDWLRDVMLEADQPAQVLIDEAALVPAGADGLVFLPYLAGERAPVWDRAARGAFVGLTLRHDRAHLARAVLEATALAVRHVAEPILASGVPVKVMRVAGGPARTDTWNRIKADVTGFPVEVPRILEAAVAGSAILAATGTGAHRDLRSAIAAMATIDRRIEPDPERGATYDRTYAAYTALHPALSPILARLHAPGVEGSR